jgi:DNA-binding MarR family transcriptional regulator
MMTRGQEPKEADTLVHRQARLRLSIASLERLYFKTSAQTSFEIIVYLTANGGSASVSSLYKDMAATEVSIRKHLRDLQELNFVAVETEPSDQRVKNVVVTASGIKLMCKYTLALKNMLSEYKALR